MGALLVLPARIRAQAPSDPALTLTTTFDRPVRAGDSIELHVNRPLAPDAGRLAVIIGHTDWSAFVESTQRGAIIRPTAVQLPLGDHQLEVYLVTRSNQWSSLGQRLLRVVAAAPSPRAEVVPTFELTNKGQVAEGHHPAANAPPRAAFQDFSLNGGIRSIVARGGWTGGLQLSVWGATNRSEALRAREQPDTAPRLDLVDYLVSAQSEGMALSLGHVTFGTHPHLFNGFVSRGARATARFGSRLDAALSALHGSTIVGWDRFLGLERREHRVVAGAVGLEILAERPGGLRLEGSWLDGKLLPLTTFNEGRINDPEQSNGIGIRLVASDGKQRVRLEGGYARSTFLNPADPLLAPGRTVAPLDEAPRNARYLDASYALVREKRVGKAMRTNIVASMRHERVDPQYGSVMANLRSDHLQNTFGVNGNVGAAVVQLSYARAHDNLDEIPALNTSFTRAMQVNASAPLVAFLSRGGGGRGAGGLWWPVVTYALNRLHQRGSQTVPAVRSAGPIPDQIATDQLLGLEWQAERLRVGYRVNHTYQDNLSTGHEGSDLANLVQNVTIGLTAGRQVDVQIDLASERARNDQLARTDVTRRVGLHGTWRAPSQTTFTGIVSTTALENDSKTTDARDVDVNVELSQGIPLSKSGFHTRRAQVFVRYSRLAGHRIDRVFAIDDRRRLWTFNTGFSVSLF